VNKIKFIVTSDWHLSKYPNDRIELSSHLPERLDSLKSTIYFIARYAIEHSIKHIVIAGDIFHNKSIIHSLALNILLKFFRDHSDLKFIIIDGNHDLSGKADEVVSALSCLDYEPNVTRISKPLKIGNILFVPYSYDMIDVIKNSSADYLISHFGLNEGMLNSGISIVADIKLKDIVGKYKVVICGHYHYPQAIIQDNIKFYYSGSIIELDYGERDEDKRFLLVDTDKNIVESILTQGYKKHYNLELNNKNKEEAIRTARELINQGHHVQFSQVEEMNISDIQEEFKVTNKVSRDITNRGITSSMSIEDKFRKYLEIKEITSDKINEYLEVGFEIVRACSEEI
jgi:DNA repair exonuclease SbcCD nuclease subunit